MGYHIRLLYLSLVLSISGIIAPTPAYAQLSIAETTIPYVIDFYRLKHKAREQLDRLTEGLHPIVVMFIYIGLLLVGIMAFSLVVICFFFLFMVLKRH